MQEKLTEVLHELRLLRSEVAALHEEVTRYKGFVGGILWAGSAMLAALAAALTMLRAMGKQ